MKKVIVISLIMMGCQTGANVPVDKGIWLDWRHVHIKEMHFHYHNTVDLGGISGNKVDQKMDNKADLKATLTP